MKTLLGLLAALLIGFGAYVAVTSSGREPDVPASIDATKDCAEGDPELSEDMSLTAQLADGLTFGDVVALGFGRQRAGVWFFESNEDAALAEQQLGNLLRETGEVLGRGAVPESQIAQRLDRRDFSVVMYQAPPSQDVRDAFARCVIAIRTAWWREKTTRPFVGE